MESHKRNPSDSSKPFKQGQKKPKYSDEENSDKEEAKDWVKAIKESKILEKYYHIQFADIMNEEDFTKLFATMREPLPITFRVIPTNFKYQVLCNLFSSPDCVSKIFEMSKSLVTPHEFMQQQKTEKNPEIEELKEEDKKVKVPIKRWDFYPGNLLYEIAMTRHELKRSEGPLRLIHKFIQQCNDNGLINRQEVVSMLPPLILDIKPGMKVLDMCAAPGSKTSQLLEKCFGDHTQHHNLKSEVTKTGIVVANDSDYARAFMLTHQLQRFDTASLLVLNHDGQNFPTIYYDRLPVQETEKMHSYDTRYHFDRVLCDVPCSSDAAIRKIPQKWQEWGTGRANSLHSLQLKLLMRALQLVKVGGKVCYSTCSMNPIEDEAVVSAALRLYNNSVELVNVDESLKGFKYRKGLTKWHILLENADRSDFIEYHKYSDVPKDLHSKLKETMFYESTDELKKFNIERCVRVFPHDQNTGGFFMAIFKKNAELGTKKTEETKLVSAEEKKSVEIVPKPLEKGKLAIGQFTRVDPRDPETEYIKIFFGLDDFPMHLLYTIHNNMKSVILVTEAVNEFLELVAKHETKDKVNITNMGVKCFERCKSQYKGTACLFRILQGAAKYLLPYMKKRTVKCNLETIKLLFEKPLVKIDEVPDPKACAEIKELTLGSFLLYVEIEDPYNKGVFVKEPIVVHKAEAHINAMAGKQDIISLKMRLFFD